MIAEAVEVVDDPDDPSSVVLGVTPCKCGVFAAECWVPVGLLAVPSCWLCAHDYVAHDRAIGSSSGAPCACSRAEIYPPDVIARRDAAAPH